MSKTPRVFETTSETYTRTESQIGQGGAGRIFLVTDSQGREFALKLFESSNATSKKLRRFQNEIGLCTRLDHPNIIKIVDDGPSLVNGVKVPFYVMPIYARSLRVAMAEGLTKGRELEVFLKVLDGVEAAHLRGIWHRDLKPENILVSDEGGVVVADFGIAHITSQLATTQVETAPNERLQNRLYFAPEQGESNGVVTHLADIYSLGLILNELFTRKIPRGTNYDTISVADERHGYLDTVVAKMTESSPSQRYDNIGKVKLDISVRGDIQIQQQRLDEARKIVVPSQDANLLLPVKIVSVELGERELHFTFNLEIEPDLAAAINRGGFSSMLGSGPERLHFSGNTATIPLSQNPESIAQQVINYVKTWLQQGVTRVNQARIGQAKNQDEERQRAHKLHLEAEETRLRIKSKLEW